MSSGPKPVPEYISRIYWTYACGCGFGMVSGALAFNMGLQESLGPGILEQEGCTNNINFFFISAFTTNAFILLHICWMVLGLRGYSVGDYKLVGIVIVSHFGCSFLTIINQTGAGCEIAIVCIYGVLLVLAYLTFHIVFAVCARERKAACGRGGAASGVVISNSSNFRNRGSSSATAATEEETDL
eukprot:Nk52_evm7s2133 gene=Nk52_evmTU7s2133